MLECLLPVRLLTLQPPWMNMFLRLMCLIRLQPDLAGWVAIKSLWGDLAFPAFITYVDYILAPPKAEFPVSEFLVKHLTPWTLTSPSLWSLSFIECICARLFPWLMRLQTILTTLPSKYLSNLSPPSPAPLPQLRSPSSFFRFLLKLPNLLATNLCFSLCFQTILHVAVRFL